MSVYRLASIFRAQHHLPYRFNCSNVICNQLAAIVQESRVHKPSPLNISGRQALSSPSPLGRCRHPAEKPGSSNPAQVEVVGSLLSSPLSSKKPCSPRERSEKTFADAGVQEEVPKISHCQEPSRLPASGQTWQTTFELRDLFSDLHETSSRYLLPWMSPVDNLPSHYSSPSEVQATPHSVAVRTKTIKAYRLALLPGLRNYSQRHNCCYYGRRKLPRGPGRGFAHTGMAD